MARTRWAILGAGLLGLAVLAAPPGRAQSLGLKARLEVRVLEIGYAPAAKSLRLRAQPLGSGAPATEMQTTDPDTIDRILRLAEIHSQGGRLAVEIEGGEIRAIDVTVGTPLRQ